MRGRRWSPYCSVAHFVWHLLLHHCSSQYRSLVWHSTTKHEFTARRFVRFYVHWPMWYQWFPFHSRYQEGPSPYLVSSNLWSMNRELQHQECWLNREETVTVRGNPEQERSFTLEKGFRRDMELKIEEFLDNVLKRTSMPSLQHLLKSWPIRLGECHFESIHCQLYESRSESNALHRRCPTDFSPDWKWCSSLCKLFLHHR